MLFHTPLGHLLKAKPTAMSRGDELRPFNDDSVDHMRRHLCLNPVKFLEDILLPVDSLPQGPDLA